MAILTINHPKIVGTNFAQFERLKNNKLKLINYVLKGLSSHKLYHLNRLVVAQEENIFYKLFS